MLLVCHFLPADPAGFPARAGRAAALLSAQPGCQGVTVGRAVDEPAHWVLSAGFDSVTAYRRALGPFEVREHVVPLLAEALPVPGAVPATFEVLLVAAGGELDVRGSLRTPAAGPAEGSGPAPRGSGARRGGR